MSCHVLARADQVRAGQVISAQGKSGEGQD